VRSALVTLLVLLPSCGAERLAVDFPDALARARARDTLAVVHFRLPGRPLSDAMDEALAPAALSALAPELVHVRVDASREPALFVRLCGGSARGGGLATCVVDPGGDVLACTRGYADAAALRALCDGAAELRAALARSGPAGTPLHALALAERFAALGRRDIAAARLAALFASADPPLRARAAARLARLGIEAGDVAGARDWLAHAGADDPHACLTRAMVQLAAREPHLARAELEALAARPDAERPAVLLHLGHAWHESGHDARALAAYAEVRARHAAAPEALLAARAAEHVLRGDHGHDHAPPTDRPIPP